MKKNKMISKKNIELIVLACFCLVVFGFLPVKKVSAVTLTGSFPYTVTAQVAATVSTEVRKVGGTWGENANVSVGDNVEVRWTSQNATAGCTCTYNNGANNCGTGTGVNVLSDPIQFYMTRPTTFKVTCLP